MKLVLHPVAALRGPILLPASKSYSIRAFIIAACGGASVIVRPSDCDDAKVAMKAARFLGARVKRVADNTWAVQAGPMKKGIRDIDVQESGTVLRFLLPLLSVKSEAIKVNGQGTLIGRPNAHLTAVLRKQGVSIRGQGRNESVPIHLRGGKFRGGKIVIDGTMSSQFISALCIACPQLLEDTWLLVKGKRMVSVDYIEMTRLVLAQSGVHIKKVSSRSFSIAASQKFQGLKRFVVPSDYGLAAFLIAAGLLTESSLVLKGEFSRTFIQADGKILEFLKKMGVRIILTKNTLKWQRKGPLRGGDFSLKDCPDLVPIMAVLALFAKGTTRLKNIKHARVKESNRISDLRRELLKAGARLTETSDTLTIHPQAQYKTSACLNPHHDHRLAMAFCVLGLKLGAVIEDIECVSKSYPGFVRDIKKLGAKVRFCS